MDPWALAVVAAFVPALAWLLFFYSRDRYEREPLRTVLAFFLRGALVAIPVALVLILVVVGPVVEAIGIDTGNLIGLFFVYLLLAGLPEEAVKAGVAVFRGRKEPELDEPADGMLYFTSVGLGFGALETTFYVIGAYLDVLPLGGLEAAQGMFVLVAVLRALTSTVAHGIWTGIVGYLYARNRFQRTGGWLVRGVGSVALSHALFNTFADVNFLISVAILVATAAVYAVLLRRALEQSPHRHLLQAGTGPAKADTGTAGQG